MANLQPANQAVCQAMLELGCIYEMYYFYQPQATWEQHQAAPSSASLGSPRA